MELPVTTEGIINETAVEDIAPIGLFKLRLSLNASRGV